MNSFKKHRASFFTIAIAYWLVSLVKTDSYYINYLLVGLVALFSLWNIKEKNNNYEIILTILFSMVLSIFVSLANYNVFIDYKRVLVNTFVGIIPFYYILIFFFHYSKKISKALYLANKSISRFNSRNSSKIFICTFVIVVIIDLIMLFFVQYPGSLSSDTIDQIGQIHRGTYSNHHPFWHTMLIKICFDFGKTIFGNANAGIATYSFMQIIVNSLIVSFANETLYRIGVNRIVNIIFLSLFILLPYNFYFSVSLWKDIPFAFSVLLFITCTVRIIKNIGNGIVNDCLLFISGVGFCLMRTNGYYAFILTFIVFVIFLLKSHKKMLLFLLLSIIVSTIMRGPVLNMLNVRQPDLIESLSIPAQQIARTVVDCNDLSNEQKKLLNNVVNVEEIENAYVPYISDNIKNLVRATNNQQYIKENVNKFIKLYIDLGIKHPLTYINAWVDQTKGYFNSGYDYWITSREIYSNNYGIYLVVNSSLVESLITTYKSFVHNFELTRPLVSIGLHTWAAIIVLYLGIIKKNINTILIITPLLGIIGTLIIASPVFCEFRYAYAIFTCLLFVIFCALDNE